MYEELNEALIKARAGDVDSKEQILNELYPLIISSIKKYYNRFFDFDDVLQEGRVVILECIDNYDESKEVYFLGYVKTMLKYYYLDKHKVKLMLSLNEKVNVKENEEEEFVDLLVSDVDDALEVLVKLEESKMLTQALSNLTIRQREIVIDYYYEGLTIDQIAEKFGIAYRTVVNTKTVALGKMKRQLTTNSEQWTDFVGETFGLLISIITAACHPETGSMNFTIEGSRVYV